MTALPSSSRSRLAGREPLVGLACLIAISIGLLLVFVLQPNETRRPKVTRPVSTRISAENAEAGTDEWANLGQYNIGELAAYPGSVSVNAGDPISIYVASTARTITARLYRLGYYQGHGARLVASYGAYSIRPQPACTHDSTTGLVGCSWLPTFTINTDPHWVSGIFLLRLDSSNGYRAFTYFVVRNDGYASDILVQEASMTNQAYNTFGGESLYQTDYKEGRTRAYKVSFDRPYYEFGGVGLLFAADIDMVRWLEASGYDVTYVSDIDAATEPALLKSHRVLLMMGHPEYWTWGERNNVEDALARGVNLVFASGNEVYWNVRLESSSLGSSRIITCYKDARLDPMPYRPFATVQFANPLLNDPENTLVGIRSAHSSLIDSSGPYDNPWVMSGAPDRWYFDCTGLQPGDQVNNIVGQEWDYVQKDGHTPPGIEILSTSHIQNIYGAPSVANSTIYTSTNGGKVFAAGSIHWSYGLIDHTFNSNRFYNVQSQAADHRIEQLMANVLDNFAGYWDGRPRACGTGNQDFYDVGDRATRTPKPEVPTAIAASHPRSAPTVPGHHSAAGTALPKATRPLATMTPIPVGSRQRAVGSGQ